MFSDSVYLFRRRSSSTVQAFKIGASSVGLVLTVTGNEIRIAAPIWEVQCDHPHLSRL